MKKDIGSASEVEKMKYMIPTGRGLVDEIDDIEGFRERVVASIRSRGFGCTHEDIRIQFDEWRRERIPCGLCCRLVVTGASRGRFRRWMVRVAFWLLGRAGDGVEVIE